MQISNINSQTPDKFQLTKKRTYFDLEERMAKFGEDTIVFCKKLKQDGITRPLINQLIRSAASIGANYCEANNASSRKDFRNKAYIAKKETQETKHWLRMLSAALPDQKKELRIFWCEAHEFVLILQAILSKIDRKIV
jgi:four helix bundle protein